MEAIPKLPMISFDLKVSTEASSFGNLKRYIAECYHEDPETYTKEIYALESLRNASCRPSVDVDGCKLLKRYYCQLHSIQSRFPLTNDRKLLSFSWRDAFSNSVNQSTDIRFEMSSILYNFGTLHTRLGASEDRTTSDGVKLACTHFQCAAWAFGHLREFYPQFTNGDMSPEVLLFMQELCFAQGQECILEKSLADNRKPGIVAKVTAQIICYYNGAFSAMLNGGEDGAVSDIIGSKHFKEWKRYVRFKISYLSCILLLYQGQQAEEQQKMGERVAFYQAAFDKMEEAKKEAKGMSQMVRINETFVFLHDVVEGKRKSAKNENEFIYHEEIPNISTFSAVQGAILVKGISFSVTDPEVTHEDIFHRLVPMKAHEASSLYSEEKSTLLRKIVVRVEEKDNELNQFMSSLNVESLRFINVARLPQELVDRCAAINAKPNAIPDLVTSMSSLAEACLDVESMLIDIKDLLDEEKRNEKSYQETMGVRPSGHIAELSREFVKYQEAHGKAGESNDTLRKAMGLHVNNLKTLAKPLSEVQAAIPVCEERSDDVIVAEMNALLNKVNEMRLQRSQLLTNLREAMNNDDITSQVIAWGDKKLDKLFKKELVKHEQSVKLIEHNLTAQTNILRALTDCYARCAPYIKAVVDTKHRREHFFSSLASSYDVYDDLLGKSSKGLEFYKKLQGNIQKLLARVKGAKDVQDEERQQRLKSTKPVDIASTSSTGPKLKDYLSKNQANKGITLPEPYIPSVRPSPLGSENYPQANDPPPPYIPYGAYNATYNQYASNDSTGQASYNQPPPYSSGKSASDFTLQNVSNYAPQVLYTQNSSTSTTPAQNAMYETNPQHTTAYSNFDANTIQSVYQFPGQSQTNQQNHPYQGLVQPPSYSVIDNTKYQPAVSPSLSQISTGSSGWISQQESQPTQIQNNIQNMHQYSNQQTIQPIASPSRSHFGSSGVQDAAVLLHQQQQQQQLLFHQKQQQQIIEQQQQQQFLEQQQQQQLFLEQQQQQQLIEQQQQLQLIEQQQQQQLIEQQQQQQLIEQQQQQQLIEQQQQQQQVIEKQQQQQLIEQQQLLEQQHRLQLEQQQLQHEQLHQQFNNNGNANANMYSDLYTTTSQSNYQITANNQYVTGYDQSGKMYSNQNSTSYGNHPGYTYNPQTGEYSYASGYQEHESIPNHNPYSQYTSASLNETSNTTDSTNLCMNGESYATQYSDPNIVANYNSQPIIPTSGSYFNLPYGTTSFLESDNSNLHPQILHPIISDNKNSTTYMQSNSQISTTTTHSAELRDVQPENVSYEPVNTSYEPEKASNEPANVSYKPGTTSNELTTPVPENVDNSTVPNSQPSTQISNIDLLSGLDFTISDSTISTQPLQPKTVNDNLSGSPKSLNEVLTPSRVLHQSSSNEMPSLSQKLKADLVSSMDNLSICSDLSSLDQNFDWESASQKNENTSQHQVDVDAIATNSKDPSVTSEAIKWFHKEVERFEKTIESVNVKTLNGSTSLDSKWKDLQDLLVKDESKRTTSVAKLFPEKNRTTDNIPYDHARVSLPTSTDNYINAVFVQELSAGCPPLILAQTPLSNTVTDFWHMIWSQKSRLITCLHSPTEMLDPFFPHAINKEETYDDFSVTIVKQFDLSHCIERNVKVTMHGSDIILDVSILQNKAWPKNSATNILGIAQNTSVAYRQIKLTYKETGPLILNCISGSERSGIVALAIAALTATSSRRPILINPIDVWYRICSQRKGALRDISLLELSMQIVLANAHNLLNKHGVMTSYQMKTTQVHQTTEKEEIKDPFSDLDPLWKLKSKK